MNRSALLLLTALFQAAALSPAALAESTSNDHAADVEAVRSAVLDYVEGLYEVAPERIARSVHPELAKRGWTRRADGSFREHPLTFEKLVEAAKRYNRDGHVADDAPKEIVIYEVLDKTASVKLTAEWGVDFMHLVKLDDKWLIKNVLWQSHPEP